MNVTKKELIEFLESFGDPKDFGDLDNIEPGLYNSINELYTFSKTYWVDSKPSDYIISKDPENSHWKFEKLIFRDQLNSSGFLGFIAGQPINPSNKPKNPCYCSLVKYYTSYERDKKIKDVLRNN